MLQKFQKHIETRLPFLKGNPLLIACSGGVDSTVLVYLCSKLGLKISLAHCNFKLRGQESDEDEHFVKKFGEQLGLKVFATSFDVIKFVQDYGGSIQMAARKLRYQWFGSLLEDQRKAYLLTAHHADDTLETFLINLSRGTGIEGLTGIPELNNKIVRPLLPFTRDEVLRYAGTEKLKWREDSSNRDEKYLRNKIRMEIAPRLKALHPSFLQNVLRTQRHLDQTNQVLQKIYGDTRAKLFVQDGKTVKIAIGDLRALEPLDAYLYGLFGPFGFTEWQDIKALLDTMSGKEVYSKTHRLLKDRTHLLLQEKEESSTSLFFLGEAVEYMHTPIRLELRRVKRKDSVPKNTIFLDKEKLNYPLVLRKWEKGDYFYPFGMKGKKKLSKFLKDEKVDVFSKENQWLLCSDGEIVWVVGRRADERFKVEESTRQIVKITFLG